LREIQDSFNVSMVYFPAFNFGVNGDLKSSGGTKIADETHIFKQNKSGEYFYD